MKKNLYLLFALMLMLLIAPSTSSALLLGNTVEYQYFFPNLSSPYSGAQNGNYVVGSGIEITSAVEGVASIDLSDTNILADFNVVASFGEGDFNGFRITDIGGTISDFTSIAINPITNMVGFDLSRISFDANHIWVNWQGLGFDSTTIVSLDINAAPVPEPSTLILLGSGLGGFAMIRRLRKSK